MATFSPKNFPADIGNNRSFSGAGERTTYAPTSKTGYKHTGGFPLEKDTPLYSNSGTIVKQLSAGTCIHFTFPAFLYKSSDFGISRRMTLAGVSLSSHTSKVDGYVSIGAVTKPAGAGQARVGAGSKTQDMVAEYMQEHAYKNAIPFADEYTTARPGSTIPDLVMTINEKRTQFEIKGSNNRTAPITFFDKSVNRRVAPPKLIEEFADVYMDKLKHKSKTVRTHMRSMKITQNFVGLIDFYKSVDSTIGLAGDEGVIRSGKLPSEFAVTDTSTLRLMRTAVLDHFKEGGDDYFVIHDRSSDNFEVYYVGGGTAGNVLGMPDLPTFKSFVLATYGGASSGSTRVGLKIKL